MRFFPSGDDYIVVLAKGDDLIKGLLEFAKQAGISTAWLSAIGAALEVELAYYDLSQKQYRLKTFTGPLEITNLTGNIAVKDKKPIFHIHGTFSSENYGAIGGHIRKLVVAATCEVFVHKLDLKLTRHLDQEVGLELLESE